MKQIHELTEASVVATSDYLVIDTGSATYKIKKETLIPYIIQPITQADYDALTTKDESTVYLIKES